MASSSSSTAILDLPREMTDSILRRLDVVERLTTAEKVCKPWREVCHDPAMWRSIEMHHTGDILEVPNALNKMFFLAVDRSQSQVTHIKLEYFGDDDLLRVVSRRCKELQRLELVFSFGVTDDGLIEAVKNLPSLEELHLYRTYACSFEAKTIKSIGQFCPKLKTFKFNHRYNMDLPPPSTELPVVAIAEAMPELRHLQLLGNKLSNEDLQAILDGCLHLESLDLRQCCNLDADESLERLCFQRIKDLKCPMDPMDDNDPYDPDRLVEDDEMANWEIDYWWLRSSDEDDDDDGSDAYDF